MHRLRIIILFSLLLALFIPVSARAQENKSAPQKEERLEVVVTDIKEEKEITVLNQKQLYQQLQVFVTSKNRKGEKLTIENGNISIANNQKYKVGDKLAITESENFEGKKVLYITDYVRRASLFWLFAIFIGITILIGKKRGIASLIGMGLSFYVIFAFVLPQILAGKDPVGISVVASLFIIPITFYLSHGFNKKTTVAVISTVISLIITGILATIFVDAARLTGFSSDEAGFLQIAQPDFINMRGLLLSGIIIGVLGILDDITISQAAIVYQLKQASPKISFRELFGRTMDVGQDHIASMVNTLVLVYTGAAMPLLLLFINTPHPFAEIINYEIIAEEVVRTLVASIGLILAVPITTLIACFSVRKD